MIYYWMILSMLVDHPKLDDLYDPLLDDSRVCGEVEGKRMCENKTKGTNSA